MKAKALNVAFERKEWDAILGKDHYLFGVDLQVPLLLCDDKGEQSILALWTHYEDELIGGFKAFRLEVLDMNYRSW